MFYDELKTLEIVYKEFLEHKRSLNPFKRLGAPVYEACFLSMVNEKYKEVSELPEGDVLLEMIIDHREKNYDKVLKNIKRYQKNEFLNDLE